MKNLPKDNRLPVEPRRTGKGRHRGEDKSATDELLEHKAKGHMNSLPSPVGKEGVQSKRNRDPKDTEEMRGKQKGFGKQQAQEGLDRKVPHSHAIGAERAAGGR